MTIAKATFWGLLTCVSLSAAWPALAAGTLRFGVAAADLGTLERDALTHALAIVKRFRALLAQRFRLDAL